MLENRVHVYNRTMEVQVLVLVTKWMQTLGATSTQSYKQLPISGSNVS
jgi:hypothetical protein